MFRKINTNPKHNIPNESIWWTNLISKNDIQRGAHVEVGGKNSLSYVKVTYNMMNVALLVGKSQQRGHIFDPM